MERVVAPVVDPDGAGLRAAAALLRAEGLVAFPTETVYGLGAAALEPRAVARIFAAKGRPPDNPLIVHLAGADDLPLVTSSVTPLARTLIATHWPGPLTLVLDASPSVPSITTGGLSTVAVRVPDHAVAAALLAEADLPVAAPSANRSGRPSPTTAQHVATDLGDVVDLIVDGGACPVGVESTVVDARGSVPIVLREGSITREDLGLAHTDGTNGAALHASPGTRYQHYQPACAVVLAPAGAGVDVASRLAAEHGRVGLVAVEAAPPGVTEVARYLDAPDLAKRLYAALRDAEVAAVDVLVVEAVAEVGVGRAVMDRLRRAASTH